MDTFFECVAGVVVWILFAVVLPLAVIAATPVVLLWPGERRSDGTRCRRCYRERYARIFREWNRVGAAIL